MNRGKHNSTLLKIPESSGFTKTDARLGTEPLEAVPIRSKGSAGQRESMLVLYELRDKSIRAGRIGTVQFRRICALLAIKLREGI